MGIVVLHKANERVPPEAEREASLILTVNRGAAVVRKNRTGSVGEVSLEVAFAMISRALASDENG